MEPELDNVGGPLLVLTPDQVSNAMIHAITEHHPLKEGEVTLLGAVDMVTGAMSRVDLGGASILVDAGKPIGRDAAGWTLPEEALGCDVLILTHGHADHVSALPDLILAGWSGPIYGTVATLELARMNGRDSIRFGGGSQDDTRRFLAAYDENKTPVRYETPTRIDGFDGQFTLHEAGHIMGSASVQIRSPHGRVLFSGDLGRPNSPILRDYKTDWDDDSPFDLVIMESTYGDREHSRESDEVDDELERAIKHALRDGGHILIPSFAIGRTQTLLYHLNTLVESGRIADLPVAIDTPMGLKVTEIYQNSRHLFDKEASKLIAEGDDPLEFDQLYAVNKHHHSIRLRDVPDPMLILAGSGMCTGGRIVGHLKDLLPKPETSVIFVGYQAHGTPGRDIQKYADGGWVDLDGERVTIQAEVSTISGLSAHAGRSELTRWIQSVPDVERIGLHHGEPDSQRAFADWLGERLG